MQRIAVLAFAIVSGCSQKITAPDHATPSATRVYRSGLRFDGSVVLQESSPAVAKVTVTVTNTTVAPITYTSGGCGIFVNVYSSADTLQPPLLDSSAGVACAAVVSYVRLEPGESNTFQTSFIPTSILASFAPGARLYVVPRVLVNGWVSVPAGEVPVE